MIRIVKQQFGSVDGEQGILLGIYGGNRDEVIETGNRLFNYGVTSTVLEVNEGAYSITRKSTVLDSTAVGLWSDTFALVLTDEKRLKDWLRYCAVIQLPRSTFKKHRGVVSGVRGDAKVWNEVETATQSAFDSIPYEYILSPHGTPAGSASFTVLEAEKVERVGDEIETLSSAARSTGSDRAKHETKEAALV